MPVRPQTLFCAAAMLALAAAPMAAFGQGTAEQQQACTPDAVKLCSDTIPDIPKTTACMKAHFSQLSPRCQTAFGEATGGAKTKAAARKPEAAPKSRSASRTERQMPEREARTPRSERQAAMPPQREAPAAAVPPTEGYPAYPSPNAPIVQAPAIQRAQIATACRIGLLDSFTCSTTVPALLGGPAY